MYRLPDPLSRLMLGDVGRVIEHCQELQRERDELRAENQRLRVLLRRIREWDMLDATADGSYWRSEIDKVWQR